MSGIPGIRVREMSVEDIPTGLSLCRASRWNQTERDWLHFLTAAPHGALAAVENGLVIGTVATLPYGPFTWISMVLVDPAARGRGVGTLLLQRGLELVPEGTTARLDATPAGEVLYRKIGFSAEYSIARWFLDAAASRQMESRPRGRRRVPAAGRHGSARPLVAADWPRLHAMDTRAFGAPRRTLLERLASDAPEYAWVSESDGALRGYLLGRHGHVREHFGPLVADGVDTARLLLECCLAALPDRDVFLDVPDDHQRLRGWLTERGFRIERPFLRMYRGRLTAPGQPSSIFAIAGPEYG